MKLGQWMQTWREGSGGSSGDAAGVPEPLAAVRTNAAAILRRLLNLLETLEGDPVALPAHNPDEPTPEELFASVEGCGATLRLSQVEHVAGQMGLLLRCVREGRLTWDRQTLDAMRACLAYVLAHLTEHRRFPRQSEELGQWNATIQTVMARLAPSEAAEGLTPTGEGPTGSETPPEARRMPADAPPAALAQPLARDELDADELVRLILAAGVVPGGPPSSPDRPGRGAPG